MDCGELVMGNGRLERNRQLVFLVDPVHELLHQRSDVVGFRRHINDPAGAAVPDDILTIAIVGWLNPGFAPAHDQSVKFADHCFRYRLRLLGQPLHFVEGRIVAFDFIFIPLPPRKVLTFSDDVYYLLLGEPVAFDHGRVVSRK